MPESTQDLPEDVQRQLQRCDGFLDLHMAVHARAEWDQIPDGHRQHPQVEFMHVRVLMAEQNWPQARRLVTKWCDREPDNAGAWILLAYTTRRAENLAAAEAILNTARIRFPQESVIAYNLACYACQRGCLDESRAWLQQASKLNPKALDAAWLDEDLRPLWPELSEP